MGLPAETQTYHLEKCKYCGKIASALYNGSPVCPAHQEIIERTKRLYDRVSDQVVEPLPWRESHRPARHSRHWRVRFEPLRIPQFNMAISFLAAGTAATNSTAGTSNAPGIPAGCTNLTTRMYAFLSINGDKTASINIPTGWTKLGAQFQTSGCTLAVYAKWFATGDGAPSFTWTTTNKNTGRILAYNGLDLTTPEDVAISFSGSAATTTPTSPTVTAVTMGACRLHIHARAGTGTSTPDVRMVEQIDQTTTSTSPAALVVDQELGMASGALGTRADTVTSAIWMAATLWLRPASPSSFGLVQSATAQANGASVTATLPATSTANNLLTVGLTSGSTNNTWTIPNFTMNTVQQNTQSVQDGYRANAPATSAVTATRSSGTDDNTIIFCEWKGASTSSPQETTGVILGTASASTATVVSGSTTSGQRLAIATFDHNGSGGTSTFDTGYVQRRDQNSTLTSPLFSESAEFAGGSTKSATFTTSVAATVQGVIQVFKVASTSNAIAGTIAAVSSLSLSLASGITHFASGTAAGQSALSLSLAAGITKKLSGAVAAQSAVGPLSLAAGITKKLSGAVAAQSAVGPVSLASGITKKLSGTIASQSSMTCTLTVTHSLAPNHIAGQSAISLSLAGGITKKLSGSIAAQSAVGPLSLAAGITKKLSGSVAGQSAIGPVSLASGITKNVSGAISGQSSITASLLTVHSLLPNQIAGLSALSAALAMTKKLSGSVGGQSSLACDLSLAKLLSGMVVGRSAIICDLGVVDSTRFLAGILSCQSAITSSLLLTKPLAGSVTAQSSISAALALTKLLSALVAAQANVQCSLTLTKLLSAMIAGQSTVACPSLAVARPLSGNVAGSSSISSSIAVTHFFAGTVVGASHLSAVLALAKLLAGQVGAQSTITCSVDILGTNNISGTISAHSTVAAALSLIKRLAGAVGAQTVITASITPLRPIKGTVSSQSSLSSVLSLTKPLSGTLGAHSSLSGALSASKALSGHIDAHSSLSSLLAASRPLSGSIDAHSSISGGVTTDHYLRGLVDAQSSAVAALELVKFLSGLLAGRSSVSGSISATRYIAGVIAGTSLITFGLTVQVYSQPIGRIIITARIGQINAVGEWPTDDFDVTAPLADAVIAGDYGDQVGGIIGSIKEGIEVSG